MYPLHFAEIVKKKEKKKKKKKKKKTDSEAPLVCDLRLGDNSGVGSGFGEACSLVAN